MGYTTEFSGAVTIEPPLPPTAVQEINAFCAARHDGHPIGIWCDWVVSEEGRSIEWNGSEKSYEMAKWMKFLIEEYVKGYAVANGTIAAQGEDSDDRWDLIVEDNVVKTRDYQILPNDTTELV